MSTDKSILLCCFLLKYFMCCHGIIWDDLDLPPQHLPGLFNLIPHLKEECRHDASCNFKAHLNSSTCWSYQDGCHFTRSWSYSQPICNGDSRGWVTSKKEQLELFYKQADFGFVEEQRQQLRDFCHSDVKSGLVSRLECTDHLKFCRGQHIWLNLTSLATRSQPVRYHMDVLSSGDVQVSCFLSAVSLYHHFCDFVNLYMSQHVNASDVNAFSTDVQVLIWETYPYVSSFAAAWRAFTRHPVRTLADFAGKRLCFKLVMFPLLPRMIFGLYYNTPLVWGCERSGLFHAFNRHMLHRLRVPPSIALPVVRVTLLARHTQHRRILNQRQLVQAARSRTDIVFNVAEFEHGQDLVLQLRTIAATDVLVGMHGAGLTHLLFLPDWAAVFEV
ncbi:EGF domain-specific O-linked N-acetylglucosamine transferase [Hyalella azteca]|uniref:EGF domain-specific O-linked N-acetylglucosamine transferase n=1 Tax=Hyalella azteca TaxID=294128 RepID=A0A8B7NK52_HYAAZ|nr:EGF domain-specific O-linked N-acetylglucosamine transferase [Hyalella azteca]